MSFRETVPLTSPYSALMDEKLYAFHQMLHELRLEGSKGRQAYCSAVLADIDAEDGSYCSLSEAEKSVFKSNIYIQIGHLCARTDNDAEAERHYLNALQEGEASGNPQAIYLSLHALGSLRHSQKNAAQALNYFQKSMLYATGMWPYNLVKTLEWIAMSYRLEPATIPQAIAFYDWVCLVKPAPLEAMIEKFTCLLLLERTEEVKTAAKSVVSDDCYALASTVAANVALRRKRKACSIASIGLDTAIAQGSKSWELCFRWFLDKC